jgi:hypothetical protein
VFCAICASKNYGPFFFAEKTVTEISYLDMLEIWLFLQLQEDSNDFIFMQDGALPHFHLQVRRYLNDSNPQDGLDPKLNGLLNFEPSSIQ